jgi:ribulose-phosphate 3-epimerase
VTISVEIAPSILSADFSRLGEEIRRVEPFAGRIHVDVMDGHFVSNLTMGPDVVRSIRPVTSLPIEVHLMVEDPAMFVEPFSRAGANRLIFHVEIADDVLAVAEKVTAAGPTAGIALKPSTPWTDAEPWLEFIDLVIVMTVEPGFGGQAFIEEMLPKIGKAHRSVVESGMTVDIEVDGGIDAQTAPRAKEAGANVFVAGNAIFKTNDPAAAAREIALLVGATIG